MVLTKIIHCKDKTITLTMERKFFSNGLIFKLDDKVIGYSRNKAINKILFNDTPMSFFEWYCLMLLINYHLFSKEDVNVGDLLIDVSDDNILKAFNTDDELTVKYIPEYKQHLSDKLTPELMVFGFHETVNNPFLNSLFKEEDNIYPNSLIINYYIYTHCINSIINSDFTSLKKRAELCKFSIELNKHIKKCTDILVKNSGK